MLDHGVMIAEGDAEGDPGQPQGDRGLSGQRRRGGRPCALRLPSSCRSRASKPAMAASARCTASTSRCAQARSSTLLGANGAGKTTTLKTISGLVRATAGSVQLRRAGAGRPEGQRHRAARRRACARRPARAARPERAREPRARRLHRRRRAQRAASGWSTRSACSPSSRSASIRTARCCRAASSRCSPSAAR